jgi:alpha-L-rhamnosidase
MDPEQQKLLPPPGAVWIGSSHPFDLHETYIRFRSPVNWGASVVPEKVDLFITADSRYKVWINGRFVARGPARCYPAFQSVDRLDITALVNEQGNFLAAEVYQPGYSHFSYLHRGSGGLLAWVVYDGRIVLVSDNHWRASRDPGCSSRVPRISIYGSGMEDRDLRQAENWRGSQFNDQAWPGARIAAPAGGAPWTSLHLRAIPLLTEELVSAKLIESRFGVEPYGNGMDAHQAVRSGWPAAKNITPVVDESGAIELRLDENEVLYLLFDLGRDYTCQGHASIEGAGGREQLSISYLEKFEEGQLVLPNPENYCRVQITDRFFLRPGSQTAETFSLRGGRYLLWRLTGPTGPALRFLPRVRISQYPVQISRPFKSSDKRLEDISRLCETTIHACLQDSFVDCTWRESSQWLGDALPQSLSLWAMTGDSRPMRQVLLMAVQGAYPDGIFPGVLPGEVHAYTIPRYNFMWVELLLAYRQITGDDDLVLQLWPALLKMLETVSGYRTREGLLLNPPGRRLYIDWSPTSQEEPHAVYNMHYVLALQKAEELAFALNFAQDAGRWRKQAFQLRPVIRQAFYHAGRWYDDLERTTYSQLSVAFAVLINVVDTDEKVRLLNDLVSRSLDPDDGYAPGSMVLASPFMHHYLFEALRQEERFEQVIEIIRLRWGRWVRQKSPTTWENWRVDFPDSSLCHGFSAHPRYHLAEIARKRSDEIDYFSKQLSGARR